MAKYRAKVHKIVTGYFEFDADDDDLARDHIDKVTQDYTADGTTDTFWNYYIDNEGEKSLVPVSLETWKEVGI